jgi:hypothetical protein
MDQKIFLSSRKHRDAYQSNKPMRVCLRRSDRS